MRLHDLYSCVFTPTSRLIAISDCSDWETSVHYFILSSWRRCFNVQKYKQRTYFLFQGLQTLFCDQVSYRNTRGTYLMWFWSTPSPTHPLHSSFEHSAVFFESLLQSGCANFLGHTSSLNSAAGPPSLLKRQSLLKQSPEIGSKYTTFLLDPIKLELHLESQQSIIFFQDSVVYFR